MIRRVSFALVVLSSLAAAGCATRVTPHAAPSAASVDPASIEIPMTESGRLHRARGAWMMGAYGSASDDLCCEPEKPELACCEDRFRFTTIRTWVFRNFVPDKSDPLTTGFEFNSAWGWGCWDVANISYIELADYPSPIPGRPVGNEEPAPGQATGLTDFLSAVLFSRKKGHGHHSPHHFAAGFATQLPTATSDRIGSGKWSLGPAVEYEYHRGRFYAAFVALQLWSFAGDDSRVNVNMMMIKPMITYDIARRWKLVYMPYGITVYWEKPVDDAIYLPLGGGIQYGFPIGRKSGAVSLQLFRYVLRPSGGPEHDLRLMLEFNS